MAESEYPLTNSVPSRGEDYILGTRIDELDVPHLVAFGLEREAAPMETAR